MKMKSSQTKGIEGVTQDQRQTLADTYIKAITRRGSRDTTKSCKFMKILSKFSEHNITNLKLYKRSSARVTQKIQKSLTASNRSNKLQLKVLTTTCSEQHDHANMKRHHSTKLTDLTHSSVRQSAQIQIPLNSNQIYLEWF